MPASVAYLRLASTPVVLRKDIRCTLRAASPSALPRANANATTATAPAVDQRSPFAGRLGVGEPTNGARHGLVASFASSLAGAEVRRQRPAAREQALCAVAQEEEEEEEEDASRAGFRPFVTAVCRWPRLSLLDRADILTSPSAYCRRWS